MTFSHSLGAKYSLIVPTRPERDRLLRELTGVSGFHEKSALEPLFRAVHGSVAVAFEDGGLLQWLDAWHNAMLPAGFHAAEPLRQARRRARGIFSALGADPDALAGRPVAALSLLETRLVGFVKAMLVEPQLLVLDGLFERLGHGEQRAVRGWIDYYAGRYPLRGILYLGLHDVQPPLLSGFSPMEALEKA